MVVGQDAAESQVGPRLQAAARAAARGGALEQPAQLEQDALCLLRALMGAYLEPGFQSEVRDLRDAIVDEARLLCALAPVAGRAQAPVFKRFGLPPGSPGVLVLKMAVKAVSKYSGDVKELAGDVRESLGLPREEVVQPMTNWLSSPQRSELEDAEEAMVARIARAPVDVRGPLAELLKLPYRASPLEIARRLPHLRQRAEEIAATQLSRGRASVIGHGKALGPELADAPDDQVLAKLVDTYEHYLKKMVARVVTPVESFTKAPAEFRCDWADAHVEPRHARELWGLPATAEPRGPGEEWLSLGVGATVIDGTLEGALAADVLRELHALEAAGEVSQSKDPCNIGARSVWLHFETNQERERLPAPLREVCLRLAGLPSALLAAAAACGSSGDEGGPVEAPRLRLHPHVMAATYRRGAEYHCHKDSYHGKDNLRMLTILLYLNRDWRPGDDGELRLFAQRPGEDAADESRFVDVAPRCGRLVMFRSREVWHAVREPREERWALTLWVMAE